jgi:hypothetical protein
MRKCSDALWELKVGHPALKDELARLKKLSGMDKAADRGGEKSLRATKLSRRCGGRWTS